MNQFLVMSAMGPDRAGIVDELSQFIMDNGGNITESRMAVLGGEFALIMLINGTDASIAGIEEGLATYEARLGLTIMKKRTTMRAIAQNLVPYDIEVVSMDHPGIVHDVSDFFANRGINIEKLETSNYAAPHTGTVMFSLNMTVGLPTDVSVGKLKREFLAFCDELNLDAEMEPGK